MSHSLWGGQGAVLITGGGQRIGYYLAEKFLALGAEVIVSYRTPRPQIDKLKQKGAIAILADFSSEREVVEFIESVKSRSNNLRAIIHNASMWSKDASVLSDPRHFTELVNVHMLAPYLINHQCRELLEAGEGLKDVIALTDYTVSKGSDKHGAYLATKAGLESMTLSFAKLFAPTIKVNAIAPALIMFNEGDTEEYKEDRLKRSALQVEPGPQVVFEAIEYLMKNIYTTGSIIPLNGGRHLV